MKAMVRALVFLDVACLALIGCTAAAKDAPQREHASVSYDGVHPATLRYGDLSISFDRVRASDGLRMPVVKGRYRNSVAFSLRLDNVERPEPSAEARVIKLDPKAALSQVVI